MSKKLINLSNLQKFLLKLNEKFALKKAMKGISEDSEGNIIIGEEGLVPTPNENSKGKFLRSDGEWALPSETAVYDSMTLEEGVAGVSKVDRVINAKNLKQIVNSDGFLTSLDSSKLTGVINIENLPQGALERILIVSSKEERLTLLDTDVQLGEVVKEADTGLMYYVINTEKLNSEEGYTQFTAGSASSVPWSGVTDKPTIPTKTSDLTNDSNFAIDSGVVHKTGNETIAGAKTFINNVHCFSLKHPTDNSYFYVSGGSDWDKGAGLFLYGISLTDGNTDRNAGDFALIARNTTQTRTLVGKPDGTLQWAGQDIATTAWVRNYFNSGGRFSAARPGAVGSSISAYYSNATTVTAEGSSSTSDSSYPSDYSDYINISPTVGTIYTGSQLFSSFTHTASGTINSTSTGSNTKLYHTTAKATANFSGAFSASAKYLCTTANAVKFRAYVSQGSDSSMGSPSVVDNSSTKSIFTRIE